MPCSTTPSSSVHESSDDEAYQAISDKASQKQEQPPVSSVQLSSFSQRLHDAQRVEDLFEVGGPPAHSLTCNNFIARCAKTSSEHASQDWQRSAVVACQTLPVFDACRIQHARRQHFLLSPSIICTTAV